MSTPFTIHVSYGSPWHVGFDDPKGVSRLLPTKRRFGEKFGRKWKLTNCPYIHTEKNVFIISSGKEEELTPEIATQWMIDNHKNVEDYLEKLNSGKLRP